MLLLLPLLLCNMARAGDQSLGAVLHHEVAQRTGRRLREKVPQVLLQARTCGGGGGSSRQHGSLQHGSRRLQRWGCEGAP